VSNHRGQSWQRWIVFGVLTLGITALWAIGAAAIMAIGTAGSPQAYQYPTEDIEFTYDGEAVIIAYVWSEAESGPRLMPRLLSGESIDEKTPRITAVEVRTLLEPLRSPLGWPNHRLIDSDQFWSDRSMEAPRRDQWYLLSEGGAEGRGYFEGFNRYTKRRLGSIGRKGFVSGTPPREDQFQWGSLFYGKIISLSREQRVTGDDALHFLDGSTLVSVNLRTWDVKALGTFPTAKALAFVRMPSRALAEQLANGANTVGSIEAGDGGPKLAVWSAGEISLIDLLSGKQTDFALPTNGWGDDVIHIYPLNEEQIAVGSFADQAGSRRATLAWLTPRGADDDVTPRTAEVTLAGSRLTVFEQDTRGISAAFPSPLILATTAVVFGPFSAMDRGADSYAEGARMMVRSLAPEMVVLTVLSAALAWWTYRREQQLDRPGAKTIAVVVLLLGVPGLLAYLAERRHVAMRRCIACGKSVPQDRPRCAACGAERARPRMTGVEVFA
jgi:hypothetical protein